MSCVWDLPKTDRLDPTTQIQVLAARFMEEPKCIDKLVQVYPVGDEISAVSQWSWGIGKGYYARIYIRDADNWKIRVEYAVLSMIPR